MDEQPKSWKYKLTVAVILSLIPAPLVWISICGPVSGAPGWLAIPVQIARHLSLAAFALLFAAPAFFLLGLYGVIRIRRSNAKVNWLVVAVAMAIAWPSAYFTYQSALKWRHTKLSAATERASTLVGALETFRITQDEYPRDLAALTPDYLSSVPETGLLLFRGFEYLPQPDRGLHPDCEGYQLAVKCPLTPFSWDFLFYWPNNGHYPYELHAAEVERIGDWGYVHR